jgi:hypothetical protein
LGAEWPDLRRLRREYTEKRSLSKDLITGKYLAFATPNEKSLGLKNWGVKLAGATDGFRTLPLQDSGKLESLKELTNEQVLATAQGPPPSRIAFQDDWQIFKVSKINLDRPQVGQQTIDVDYRSSYLRTVPIDGQTLEINLPIGASGTLIRSETILGMKLYPGQLKNDAWKKSVLSR